MPDYEVSVYGWTHQGMRRRFAHIAVTVDDPNTARESGIRHAAANTGMVGQETELRERVSMTVCQLPPGAKVATRCHDFRRS